MYSPFDPANFASNDQSVSYLGYIFGNMGSILPYTQSSQIISTMFQFFNTAMLSLGVLVVIYTTIVGLLKTAAEGEFLGKQWSSIWVPLRMVFGIAFLYPSVNGYSLIQVILMWVILQGIGMADGVWNTALSYIGKTGSAFSSPAPSATDITGQMQGLFQGLVCQASARAAAPTGGAATYPSIQTTYINNSSIDYYCTKNPADAFCSSNSLGNIYAGDASMPAHINYIAGTTTSSGTITYVFGPQNDASCGKLTYCDPSFYTDQTSLYYLACKAQQDTLNAIINGTNGNNSGLASIAKQFVDFDYDYLKNYETIIPANGKAAPPQWIANYCASKNIPSDKCCVYSDGAGVCIGPGSFEPDVANADSDIWNTSEKALNNVYFPFGFAPMYGASVDFISTAVVEYQNALSTAFISWVNNTSQIQPDMGWTKDASSIGWIFAGAYYYKIAQLSAKNIDGANPTFQVSPIETSSGPMHFYRNNYSAANALVQNIQQASSPTSSGSSGQSFGAIPHMNSGVDSAVSGAGAAIFNNFKNNLTTSGDPIVRLGIYGHELMKIATGLFFTMLTLASVLSYAATINPIGLGTSWTTTSPWFSALQSLVSLTTPFFLALIAAIYSLGATFAIYIPLIPYIIFSMGAIGWMIATMEAMVAGPLVAIGILSPGGQSELLGRSLPGLWILFNLFLRPSLMIFGMIFSMLFSVVVFNMIAYGFNIVMDNLTATAGGAAGRASLFVQIILISVYASFIITVVNKIFSLIHHVPEKVLAWLEGGGGQHGYGEEQAAQGAQKSTEAGAGGVAGGGKESGAAGVTGGAKQAKVAAKRKEAGKGPTGAPGQ